MTAASTDFSQPTRPLRVALHEDDVVFFLHIPKTAGISMISFLDAQYPKPAVFPLHSAPDPSLFDLYTPKMYRQYRLIRGHFRYGPYDNGIYRNVAQNPIMITVLREPVLRTLSAYRHTKREPENLLYPKIMEEQMSFVDYATCDDEIFWHRVVNHQTRQIVGNVWGNSRQFRRSENPIVLSDEALLNLAKQRLEKFAFVGLTERFNESLELLAHTFGWPPPEQEPRLNTAPRPTSRDQLTEEELAIVSRRVALDIELYRFAEELLDRRLAQMRAEQSHA